MVLRTMGFLDSACFALSLARKRFEVFFAIFFMKGLGWATDEGGQQRGNHLIAAVLIAYIVCIILKLLYSSKAPTRFQRAALVSRLGRPMRPCY